MGTVVVLGMWGREWGRDGDGGGGSVGNGDGGGVGDAWTGTVAVLGIEDGDSDVRFTGMGTIVVLGMWGRERGRDGTGAVAVLGMGTVVVLGMVACWLTQQGCEAVENEKDVSIFTNGDQDILFAHIVPNHDGALEMVHGLLRPCHVRLGAQAPEVTKGGALTFKCQYESAYEDNETAEGGDSNTESVPMRQRFVIRSLLIVGGFSIDCLDGREQESI
ncbi:hypothetical protein BS17DRAFT_770291 [Gyrodon lividus]|nr:hypothetical protein BS17DRAFT_770291 [Gyrodon lividus]